MEIEDNLSDASLVEEEDEEDEIIDYDETPIENPSQFQNAGEIELDELESEDQDLEPALEMDLPDADESLLEDPDENPDFHGFTENDMIQSTQAAEPSGDMDYNKNVNYPFPKDMSDCSGHYAGPVPFYTVHWAPEKPKIIEEKVVLPTVSVDKSEDEKKVKPLKIKKSSISTPSPMLQRESREWKPSSQFFKPLTAGRNYRQDCVFWSKCY